MAEPKRELLPPEANGTAPGRSRLVGRRVLVIGGGQADFQHIQNPPIGNGRAICMLFAKEGASVAVQDLRLESAEATVTMIKEQQAKDASAKSSASYVALQGDASKETDVIRVLRQAEEQLGGPIDGLVLNVGIAEGVGFNTTSSDEWDRTFAVNVRSHFLFCKHYIPKAPSGSSILLISSVAARTAASNLPAYGASKSALDGLMRHAGKEGGRRGIRVNVLQFGLVDTGLGRETTRNRPNRVKAKVPVGNRQGTAWEMANYALFLISNDSTYGEHWLGTWNIWMWNLEILRKLIDQSLSFVCSVTGQTHVCDGGVTSLL